MQEDKIDSNVGKNFRDLIADVGAVDGDVLALGQVTGIERQLNVLRAYTVLIMSRQPWKYIWICQQPRKQQVQHLRQGT